MVSLAAKHREENERCSLAYCLSRGIILGTTLSYAIIIQKKNHLKDYFSACRKIEKKHNSRASSAKALFHSRDYNQQAGMIRYMIGGQNKEKQQQQKEGEAPLLSRVFWGMKCSNKLCLFCGVCFRFFFPLGGASHRQTDRERK